MRPPVSVLCVAVLLSAAGCNRDPAVAGRPVIAVVPKGTQHEFWKSVHAGAAAAAAAAGVEIQWNGPQLEGDRASQIQLLQNFISKRVQGIVLAPVDQVAIATVVAEAKAAGVPTVVIDSALDGDAHVAYVATDNKEGGGVAAARLGELLAGKGKVVMLRFQQGSASTMAREAGFLEVLAAKFPGVQVISDEQYAGDLDKARAAADSLLVAHPDVDGVFCPNESTTHGFLLALQSCGKAGKVRFVGFDASPPLVDGLERGQIHGLVLQDPVAIGRRGVETMVAHLRGQHYERVQTTPLLLATPENRTRPDVAALLHPAIR
jgi:ribose transport system substrate-binding protein